MNKEKTLTAITPKYSKIFDEIILGSFLGVIASIFGYLYVLVVLGFQSIVNLLISTFMLGVGLVIAVLGYFPNFKDTVKTMEDWSVGIMNTLEDRVEEYFKKNIVNIDDIEF